MKTTRIFQLIILLLLNTGCKHEKTCPQFNTDDLDLVPYAETDTLTFVSQENEFFSIYIQHFDYSESYQVEYRGFKEEACLNYLEVVASDTKNDTEYTFLKLEQSDVSAMQYYKYTLMNFYFEIDFDNEVPYIHEIDYLDLIPALTLGDTTYTDVIIYQDLHHASPIIHSVYLSKKDGIIKFTEDESSNEWSRIR